MNQRLVQLPVLEGEDSPAARLSKASVRRIKLSLADGESVKRLADLHGVTYQTIYLIGIGEIWKSVEPLGRVLPKRSRITPALRDRMFRFKRKRGATNKEVAVHFGVSTSAVSRAMKDGRAAFAIQVQRAVLSSGTYDQVCAKYGIKRAEVEELLAFIADGDIPEHIKAEE